MLTVSINQTWLAFSGPTSRALMQSLQLTLTVRCNDNEPGVLAWAMVRMRGRDHNRERRRYRVRWSVGDKSGASKNIVELQQTRAKSSRCNVYKKTRDAKTYGINKCSRGNADVPGKPAACITGETILFI